MSRVVRFGGVSQLVSPPGAGVPSEPPGCEGEGGTAILLTPMAECGSPLGLGPKLAMGSIAARGIYLAKTAGTNLNAMTVVSATIPGTMKSSCASTLTQ